MELERIFKICQRLKPVIKYIQFGEIIYSNGSKRYQIIDWESYTVALNKLNKIAFLTSTIGEIYSSLPAHTSCNEIPLVDGSTKSAILDNICILIIKLETICDLAGMACISGE